MVFIGAPITIVLGTFGYWFADGSTPGARAWLNAFYHSIQLLLMHMVSQDDMPLTLECARWMAFLLFGMTAVLTFLRFFRDEMRQIRLQIPWPRHVVICGLGSKTLQLVQCYRNPQACKETAHSKPRRQRVVVVSPSANDAGAEACREKGVTVVTGDLLKPATLSKARVDRASHVIALSEEDSTNMAIINEAHALILKRGGRSLLQDPVKCFIHLGDIDTRASLQASQAFRDDPRCEIHFFDLFDTAARKLLQNPNLTPLDRGGIKKNEPRQAHLVILGFGRMGRTVALRAAQLGHFANGKPLKISVIDQHAERRKQALLFRYPNFEKTCEIEFHELEMESLRARQLLETWCADTSTLVSVAACFDRDALGLEVALLMKAKLEHLQVPMFVRMSSKTGFASVFQTATAGKDSALHAFGMLEDCCSDELLENKLNETLAQAIHTSYQINKIAALKRDKKKPEDEPSVQDWKNLFEYFKDSNRQQADHIDMKLRAIGLERADIKDPRGAVNELEDPDVELLAEMEHNRWNAERLLDGWVYGEISDKKRKISACIVPWNELPDDIKEYDRQTVRKIPDFLHAVKQKICKKTSLNL
ncbi:MAG TPA: NAD-binding protein [Kiritimatiellia bacterium]|nr:NAD-binding protein [Kiritimatiellia bacterium]HPS07922.1 NAD-binding protein [Kiritimatiellia bacterium]